LESRKVVLYIRGMKSIKIGLDDHKTLKVFCAKNDMPMAFVIGQSIAMYIHKHKEIETNLKKNIKPKKTKRSLT